MRRFAAIEVAATAQRQRGMTLVELLVAMVVGLVIVLAAVASLTVARRGFSTVDAASQLRDNGRYAADLIQRLGVQVGYRDIDFATRDCRHDSSACNPEPDVTGVDNAIPSSSDPTNGWTTRASGSIGFGSDILVLQNQTSALLPQAAASNASDGSMIDCLGQAPDWVATDRNERMFSVLYVGPGVSGEPALLCYAQAASGAFLTQPIVDGVENFQVLYGVDGVSPNAVPSSAATATDGVPERYLTATEMNVIPANPDATKQNWRRVRSIRIGMVLRGPPGSAQGQASQTLYTFAPSAASSAAAGAALSSSTDEGTIFTPPNDGRLRQVVTFTVHLRNPQ